ncbi:hypothetical protein ACFYY8_31775 [Streptosporangium sp. NPDC001559]|uniref:hypothetical protein n=1 Tax=Streptosporangium sp. NPDC001559 TaxID=3366187 RepID=UPI0036EFC01F
MSTTKTAPPDWSLTPRGTASSTGLGALALAAVAAGGDMLQLHPGWAAGGAVLGVVGTVLSGSQHHPRALAYRLGCWLGAGGWLAWTWADTPWDLNAFAALGLGALGAGLFAPWARTTTTAPASPSAGAAVVMHRHATLATAWAERIHRVADVRVQVEDLREWDGGGGFSALVMQPLGGSSTSKLRGAAVGLAEDARLPNGCGVEFGAGPFRGSLRMHVSTLNRLAETIPHPGIRLGGSINDPDAIRLGGHRDGSTATVALRESTMALAGQKRSGKSGTLHNITADAGALDDCLVWHMDLNGGGISRAWLRCWLDGRTPRPAIDWAAGCPEEALLMAQALVDIAKDRKSAHADLKAAQDVQLLPVSRQVPAILLILDEGKEVLGTKITEPLVRAIRRALETTVDIGGNEAVNAVLSVLRSTSTALSTDILKQCSTRATMRVFDQSEIDYLFGYRRGVSPQDAPEQGSGFLQAGAEAVRVFKAYFMVPSDIDAAAVQIAAHRPDLDADAVRAAGPAYATRLERMRYLYSTPSVQATLPAPEPIDLPGFDDGPWYPAGVPADGAEPNTGKASASGTVARRRPGHLTLLNPGGATAGWDDPETIAARARSQQSPRLGGGHQTGPGPRPRLRAEQVHEVPAEQVPVPALLTRAIAAFDGDDRIHSATLADRLDIDQVELAELLRGIGVRTLQRAFMRGGEERRGYGREDLEAAAAAIRSGDLQVPPEVEAWPAA